MTRYLITAGGSGGHVFPALAIMHALVAKGCDAAFVTDQRGARFCKNVSYHQISAQAIMGKGLLTKVKGLFVLGIGYIQSHILLWRTDPDRVIGFGGYAALPLVLAAQHQGRVTFIHEQNAIMGRVNRLLAQRARQVFLSFPDTQKVPTDARTEIVGNPLENPEGIPTLADKIPSDHLEILVLGGSQGAGVFDTVVPDAIARLFVNHRARIRIIQQVATVEAEDLQNRYAAMGVDAKCADFIPHVAQEMPKMHLLITRAGGGVTTEASLASLPCLFVPLPIAADNHQWFNANFYASRGAAEIILQKDFYAESLARRLEDFLLYPQKLEQMRANMTQCAAPQALTNLLTRLEAHDSTA